MLIFLFSFVSYLIIIIILISSIKSSYIDLETVMFQLKFLLVI